MRPRSMNISPFWPKLQMSNRNKRQEFLLLLTDHYPNSLKLASMGVYLLDCFAGGVHD